MTDVRWRAFTVLFAVACCFHVLGNAVFADPSGVVVVALGAAAVVWRPGDRRAFALLAVGVVLMAWQEAPLLSNHWALAAFVAVAVIVAGTGERALSAARACFLGFYAFAAFAKLNSDFLDPAVTCSAEYLADTADAIGLGGLDITSESWVRTVTAYATAAVELSIPLLLVRRRTRTIGVMVAVLFHAVVALPRDHQFFDFSSVLLAGWSTFLPASFHRSVADAVRRVLRPAGLALVALTGVLGASSAGGGVDRATLIDIGWWAWQPLAWAAVVAVVVFAVRHRAGDDVALRPPIGVAAVVPLLVVLNGLTPYVELKTQASWNMYANLRTAGGESNHLVVRRTFPITSPQDDLVTVVETDDPLLLPYQQRGFLLPVRTMRAYVQDHPSTSAELLVGDDSVTVTAGEPVPERLGPTVPGWAERWFVLRAVDGGEPERCQTGFLPAR